MSLASAHYRSYAGQSGTAGGVAPPRPRRRPPILALGIGEFSRPLSKIEAKRDKIKARQTRETVWTSGLVGSIVSVKSASGRRPRAVEGLWQVVLAEGRQVTLARPDALDGELIAVASRRVEVEVPAIEDW